jgi:hypothetical protein
MVKDSEGVLNIITLHYITCTVAASHLCGVSGTPSDRRRHYFSQTFSSPPSNLSVAADDVFSYVIATELPEFRTEM